MRSRLALVASGVLMLALLAGTGTPASADGFFGVSVANLGDSFASGEGGTETGPYLPGSDTPTNRCHRSATSPAELLARLGLVRMVVDAACSGATTANVTSIGQYGEPPQADQLSPAIRRVYLMIGGNDIGFGTLLGCFLLTDCSQTPVPAISLQLIGQLGSRLDAAYGVIRAKAPEAGVVVPLYPRLLPQGSNPDLSRCPELNQREVALGNQIEAAANQVIADRARAHGFRVANPAVAFQGHDVCAAQPFFYRPGTVPAAATYHPNILGRADLAAVMAVASA